MEVSLFDSSPTKRSARCAGPVELCHCLQGRFQKKNEEASRNSFCGSKSHFDTYTHVVLVTHALHGQVRFAPVGRVVASNSYGGLGVSSSSTAGLGSSTLVQD